MVKWFALGAGIGIGLPLGLLILVEGFNIVSARICGSLVNPEG